MTTPAMSDVTDASTNDNTPQSLLTVSTALTAIALTVIIISTIIGNVFVIVAIVRERSLQSTANHLIISLAVADLLVSCLVMPLGAAYEITSKWSFGARLCDLWTSADVLCCTASILHLLAIALDRFWAVTNVNYIHSRSAGRILLMIIGVWSLSLVVSVGPLLGWKDHDYKQRVVEQQQCIVSQDVGYQVFATVASFYVPLILLLSLYYRIFQEARARIRQRANMRASAVQLKAKQANSVCKEAEVPQPSKILQPGDYNRTGSVREPDTTSVEAHSVHSSDRDPASQVEASGVRPATEDQAGFTEMQQQHEGTTVKVGDRLKAASTVIATSTTTTSVDTTIQTSLTPLTVEVVAKTKTAPVQTSQRRQRTVTKKETIEAKRERKAAKTLAIVTGVFIVCWLPFFLMAIIMPLCGSTCHFEQFNLMSSVFLWLGWLNSTLNPIIYTVFSPDFRRAFQRILCGRRASGSARAGGRRP